MARASSDDDGVCAETGGRRIEKYARSGSIADGGVGETRRTRERRSKERPCRSTTCRPRPPFRGNSWHARSRRILRGDGQSNARRLIVGEGNARIMAEQQNGNATNFSSEIAFALRSRPSVPLLVASYYYFLASFPLTHRVRPIRRSNEFWLGNKWKEVSIAWIVCRRNFCVGQCFARSYSWLGVFFLFWLLGNN